MDRVAHLDGRNLVAGPDPLRRQLPLNHWHQWPLVAGRLPSPNLDGMQQIAESRSSVPSGPLATESTSGPKKPGRRFDPVRGSRASLTRTKPLSSRRPIYDVTSNPLLGSPSATCARRNSVFIRPVRTIERYSISVRMVRWNESFPASMLDETDFCKGL